MRAISLFNDVIGPVMRGPSSSHTAGPYHIGRLMRDLISSEPQDVTFTFDPQGSFARVYDLQKSDAGFVAGLLGIPITSPDFPAALQIASGRQVAVNFQIAELAGPDHPNLVFVRIVEDNATVTEVTARSTGGGTVVIDQVNQWPLHLTGEAFEVMVEMTPGPETAVIDILKRNDKPSGKVHRQEKDGLVLLHCSRQDPLEKDMTAMLSAKGTVRNVWSVRPVFKVKQNDPLFGNSTDMLSHAIENNLTLGRCASQYEAVLLGQSESEIHGQMQERLNIMRASVKTGLQKEGLELRLVTPCAGNIMHAEATGKLAAGGLHSRAAARALAVMHSNNANEVVCAAPTAGAAGVIPAVLETLRTDLKVNPENLILALFAASAVGLGIAQQATFAAEVAGCQVEIGAAGAMAAAAVVEAFGGNAAQACDSAAIALQNTMGSVCDLVQGLVEIPCHTRNAAAASAAFVCADLILGGYRNPIPLGETIDAMLSVGRMLPPELRCTALGGLAQAPSALAMSPKS